MYESIILWWMLLIFIMFCVIPFLGIITAYMNYKGINLVHILYARMYGTTLSYDSREECYCFGFAEKVPCVVYYLLLNVVVLMFGVFALATLSENNILAAYFLGVPVFLIPFSPLLFVSGKMNKVKHCLDSTVHKLIIGVLEK